MTETTALALCDVRLAFADIAFRFECEIKAGGIVAVTGASGSGKSTLFNLIAGFEQPDRGRIHVFGKDMAARAPAERPVSVVFQDHNLFAHLDIFTNIGLGIDPAMRLTAVDRARIDDALARVGLDGFGARSPQTLSGGERQRVALARALVRKRPLLLLDEPFAALDPGLRAEMTGLLRDLHREAGNTMLMITHQPGDVENLADEVLFLDKGSILLHEAAGRFLHNSLDHPQVARFLGSPPPRLP